MKLFSAVILVLCLFSAAPAFAWRGLVENVEGCEAVTVKVDGAGRSVMLKLYGVTCPSSGEAGDGLYAERALELLRGLLPKDLPVIVHDMRQDVVGRDKGAMITLPDGRIVQEELLKAGLARVSPLHCGNCWRWKKLQRAAEEAKIGLWRVE